MKTTTQRFIRNNLTDILHAAGPILVMAITIVMILVADIRSAMNQEVVTDYQASNSAVTMVAELSNEKEQL